MPFIKLTRRAGDGSLIVLNTDHIAQVEVNPDSYDTVITMADGEQIYVNEDLPAVLAMLPGAAPAPHLTQHPDNVNLSGLQRTAIAAALYQLASRADGNNSIDREAQRLMAPIAREWNAASLRLLASNLLRNNP